MNNIDGIAFHELESEKYWSFPKSYKKDAKTETKNMVFSGEYIGSRKMDGAYFRFIKDNEGMCVNARSVIGMLYAMTFNELWCESDNDIYQNIKDFIIE